MAKQTFAQRAKAIQAKYSRHKWDKLEREDMMKELEALKDEQEGFRMDNGMDDNEGEEALGGNIDKWLRPKSGYTNYDGFGDTQYLNKNPYTMPTYNTNQPMSFAPAADPNVGKLLSSVGVKSQGQGFQPIQTSVWPAVISSGVSAIGNVAGLIGANKNRPDPITLPRMAATNVNLESQREGLRRSYSDALNIALNRSRNASNESNAYANQVGALTGLTDSLGSKMSESYLNEATTNAGYANQAAQVNQATGVDEVKTNAKLQEDYNTTLAGYRDQLFNTVPEAMRDYRAQRSQDMWMNTMGKEYGLMQKTNPNETSWQKFMRQMGGTPYEVRKR